MCYLAFLQGDNGQAHKECSAALDADGGSPEVVNNLALVYAASGDLARAFETFTVGGGTAMANYNIGIILLAKQQYPAAVIAFEAAYRIEPSFEKAHTQARSARLRAHASKEISGDRR